MRDAFADMQFLHFLGPLLPHFKQTFKLTLPWRHLLGSFDR
jgi:hypothetical protein